MTVVAIWREENALWAAADTRFSKPGSSDNAQLITDHGPKIFPLPVTVKEPDDAGFFNKIKFSTTVGFAYAGMVPPALATHALSSAVLQSLISHSASPPPSLESIAEFVRRAAERYMRDWGQLNPAGACFDSLVFGWCPVKREYETYHLTPQLKGSFSVRAIKDPSDLTAIGSGASELRDKLNILKRDGDPYHRSARLPLLAIESLVTEQTRGDVGGAIQLAHASPRGVGLFARCSPIVRGQPAAMITFLGIDTNELGPIGDCQFCMNALA